MWHCQPRGRRNTMSGQSGIAQDHGMATTAPSVIDETSWRYPGWRVVLACFLAAVCCWGFGLYGHGVYLTELSRLHGWPTWAISAGVTGFYLLTATVVVFINDAVARLGPKKVMLIGACSFGSGVALLAVIDALWQFYIAYVLMAIGAATMHVGAISNVVGLWFEKRRGLALSLALNGASSGGILVTLALVLAIAHFGFSRAILGAMAIMAAILIPAIAFWIDRPAARGAGAAASVSPSWTRGAA